MSYANKKSKSVSLLAQSVLRAFKSNDLSEFQRLVDLEAFANNLASAMTEDLLMPSDYMIIASNCSMTALLDAMDDQDPYDLVMLPVKITYKEVLRNLVLHRSLISEDLLIPENSLYIEDKTTSGLHQPGLSSHLASHFAPKVFLDLFGRKWSIPDPLTFTYAETYVEFNIQVENENTAFRGDLTVRATETDTFKLELSFPNFIDLQVAAQKHRGSNVRFIDPTALKLARGVSENGKTSRSWRYFV